MEEILEHKVYLIDLSNIDFIPEILYKLSSILENEEVKNKQLCIKLSNVNFNQAQLLSIKSLTSGIGASIYCIDTLSEETKNAALSLGINCLSISEEKDEETKKKDKLNNQPENEVHIEKDAIAQRENTSDEEKQTDNNEKKLEIEEKEFKAELDEIECPNSQAENEQNLGTIPLENEISEHSYGFSENAIECETKLEEYGQNDTKEDVQDELDLIFNSAPEDNDIFHEENSIGYEARESIPQIVVPEKEYTKEDMEIEEFSTKYIKQTIRSGQVINHDGNLVIIGDCHSGSEISAYGDITVWGLLNGIAHAGANGNKKAKIRALKMNAIQLRIADLYTRRPDNLNMTAMDKTNSFIPEEAKIINGEILVFKIND